MALRISVLTGLDSFQLAQWFSVVAKFGSFKLSLWFSVVTRFGSFELSLWFSVGTGLGSSTCDCLLRQKEKKNVERLSFARIGAVDLIAIITLKKWPEERIPE